MPAAWFTWWTSAARSRQFGFAYGTLTGHAETGEERFTVELRPEDRNRLVRDLRLLAAQPIRRARISPFQKAPKAVRARLQRGHAASCENSAQRVSGVTGCDSLSSGWVSGSCRWKRACFTSGQNSFITCENASVAQAIPSLSMLSPTVRVSG